MDGHIQSPSPVNSFSVNWLFARWKCEMEMGSIWQPFDHCLTPSSVCAAAYCPAVGINITAMCQTHRVAVLNMQECLVGGVEWKWQQDGF